MIPELINLMLPPNLAELTPLPQGSMADHIATRKGDKAMILRTVATVYGTAVNDDLWPSISAATDAEELDIFYLQLIPACTTTELRRLTQLLHRKIENPLLLLLKKDDTLHISASTSSGFISFPLPHELPTEFITDMDIRQGYVTDLRALYNRWLCALYALQLYTNDKLRALSPNLTYLHFDNLQHAQSLCSRVSELLRLHSALTGELRTCRMPGKRVDLANSREDYRKQLLFLTTPP